MMIRTRAVSLGLTISFVALTACGGSDAADESADADAVEATEDASTESAADGADDVSEEIVAAADKITFADESIDDATARCIAAEMVADGSIGIGEVLTMNFLDLESNADRLQEAYASARATC